MPHIDKYIPRDLSSIALEDSALELKNTRDQRRRMEEPPPVSLVAIADVVLPATTGLEHLLDDFYVGVFGFIKEREGESFCYLADNFCLRFDWREGFFERDSLRPLAIDVGSIRTLQDTLLDREIEFQYERGLAPGSHSLLLLDPAGNTVQVFERPLIR